MIEISEASGNRVFVVGDVHGCASELSCMLDFLVSKENFSKDDLLVVLGDYIDRGPDSKGVVDLLVAFHADYENCRFLRGNHEDMLMDFFGFGGHLGHAFLYNGGLETIQSYGISVFSPPSEMMQAMPEDHFKFFCNLDSVLVVDDFILVHAGLNPYNPITQQTGEDLFWIREPFLESTHEFEKIVVFGHTPHKEVYEHKPFKLGIDTGLVFGNKLTCIELNSSQLYQVGRNQNEVVLNSLNT